MGSVSSKMINNNWGKSETSETLERERWTVRYILQHSQVCPFKNQLNYTGEENQKRNYPDLLSNTC